jgi:DNA-binding HxlR family transcriptional regulator
MAKKLAKNFNCPTEFALDILGGKWKTVILCYLKEGPLGYADLRRLVPALSDKVLSERLRELMDKGLVSKTQSPSRAGAAVYALSPKGRSLGSLLHELYQWGLDNSAAFGVKVGEPLKELGYLRQPRFTVAGPARTPDS